MSLFILYTPFIEAFLKFSGSLVATLRAAEKFEKSHLSSPEVAPLVESARFYYMDGYFLTHGLESALYLSSKSAAPDKVISFSITMEAETKLSTRLLP